MKKLKKRHETLRMNCDDIDALFNVDVNGYDYIVCETSYDTFHDLPEDIHQLFRKYDVVLPYKREIDDLYQSTSERLLHDDVKRLFTILSMFDNLPHTIQDFKQIKYVTPYVGVFVMRVGDFIRYREFINDVIDAIHDEKIQDDDLIVLIASSLYFVNTFKKILRLEVING
jgi:hypothetical protein